jgi:hypothetical protein
VEWVVREGVKRQGGEMNQALYAHMNKRKGKKRKIIELPQPIQAKTK